MFDQKLRIAIRERPVSTIVRETEEPPFQPLRVLVVDAVLDIAESVALILQDDGHTVEIAKDGADAIRQVGTFCPDVVLLDIELPQVHDHLVVERIKAQGVTPRIIAMSGWVRVADRRRAFDAGFDYFLPKPLDFEALLRLLRAQQCGSK